MIDPDAASLFNEAVLLILRLETNEAEALLKPLADLDDVTALTLRAEVAWTRAMMSEDKEELKKATARLEKAEVRALKVCDSARGTMLGSIYKYTHYTKTKSELEQVQDVINCTNLAYLYLMEALAAFRGPPRGFISGAFKLKSSWRLYKYLAENDAQYKLHNVASEAKTPGLLRSKWRMLADLALRNADSSSSSSSVPLAVPGASKSVAGGTNKQHAEMDDSETDDDFHDASSALSEESGDSNLLPSSVIGDIKYGLGSFHFFVSMVPSGFKWIVESLGFQGDKLAGRAELEECVARRGHRAASALLLLIWMDTFFYKDRVNAESLLREAEEMFEEGGTKPSPLFRYLGGYLARVQGNMETAVARFQAAREASEEVHVLQLMCDYEIGWCYFLQCKFERAIAYYEPFLKKFKPPSYRAYASYQLGCALDMVGRTAEARPYMAAVHKLVRKNYTFDQFAARKAAQWLKSICLTDVDKYLLIVFNHLEAKNFVAAMAGLVKARKVLATQTIRSMRQLLPITAEIGASDDAAEGSSADVAMDDIPVTSDNSAVYTYSLGRAYRGLGRIKEAMDCYQRLIAGESFVKEEVYIMPYTYCEVGELLLRDGKFADARHYLRIAKTKYQNYDFDKPLGRRLKLAFDLVKEQKRSIK